MLTLGNIYALSIANPGSSVGDVARLITIASLPIFPIIGFHVNQAHKQFRAGYTLGDLRSALEIAQKERVESAALAREGEKSVALRALQLATIASASWLAVTAGLLMSGNDSREPYPHYVDLRTRFNHDAARCGEQCARRAVHSHKNPQLVADGDPRASLEQSRWGVAGAPTRSTGAVASGGRRRVPTYGSGARHRRGRAFRGAAGSVSCRALRAARNRRGAGSPRCGSASGGGRRRGARSPWFRRHSSARNAQAMQHRPTLRRASALWNGSGSTC